MTREFSKNENETATLIVKRIHEFDKTKKYKEAPGNITVQDFLEKIKILRNDRSHRWDSEENLKPLMDAGIGEFVCSVIEKIFSKIDIKIRVPLDISEKHLRVFLFDGIKQSLEVREEASDGIKFGTCYLQYFDDESHFLYRTDLIDYETERNQPYVYLALKHFQYESVPLQGAIDAKSGKIESFEDAFSILDYSQFLRHEKSTQMDVHEVLDTIETNQDILLSQMPQPISKWLGTYLKENKIPSEISTVIIGAFWKEYHSRWNLDWKRRRWYRDLIIEAVKRR